MSRSKYAPLMPAREVGRKGDTTIAFKAICLSDLPSGYKKVAAALLDHYNKIDGRCDPSMETIAILVGLTRRHVQRIVNQLVRAGLFKALSRAGHFHCNHYIPVWSKFRQMEAAWKTAREKHRDRFNHLQMSLEAGHASHVDGDLSVSQTNPSNQSHTTSFGGGGVANVTAKRTDLSDDRQVRQFHAKQRLAEQHKRNTAHQHWDARVRECLIGIPEVYAAAVDAIDPELIEAATDAELEGAGGGAALVLHALSQKGVLPERSEK